MPTKGDLRGAVATRGRAQQRRRCAAGRFRRAVRRDRRPRLCAPARAGRLCAGVGLEEVESLPVAIDQDLAQTAVSHGDGC